MFLGFVAPPAGAVGLNELRCAVVGSSSMLLQQQRGARIDGHDIIVRLNGANVNGFEAHVGSRTDVRVLSGTVGIAASVHANARGTSPKDVVDLTTARSQLLLWLPSSPDDVFMLLTELWRNASWARPHAIQVRMCCLPRRERCSRSKRRQQNRPCLFPLRWRSAGIFVRFSSCHQGAMAAFGRGRSRIGSICGVCGCCLGIACVRVCQCVWLCAGALWGLLQHHERWDRQRIQSSA